MASDLDAFKRVLEDGEAGVLVRRGDADALGRTLSDLLDDPGRRAELSAHGAEVAAGYDWEVLARRILAVYETVVLPGGPPVGADDEPAEELPAAGRRALSSLLRWGDG